MDFSKDYYKVLGLDKSATDKEIKKAYRRLARRYHPDASDDSNKSKFNDISEAYEILSDPEKRKKYDHKDDGTWFNQNNLDHMKDIFDQGFKKAKTKSKETKEKTNPDNIKKTFNKFSDIFNTLKDSVKGDEQPSKHANKKRAKSFKPSNAQLPKEDIEQELSITLEEAHRGTKKLVSLKKENTCVLCGGTGDIGAQTCRNCYGQGKVQKSKQLEVNVPAGVRKGSKVRIVGEGNGIGDNKGNLYLKIMIKSHRFFAITDNGDIHCDIPITVPESVVGVEIEVPTLSGRVKMKIPSGTQNHQVFRLKGKGLKGKRSSDSPSDQYVTIQIETPKTLTSQEQQLYSELAKLQKQSPRDKIFSTHSF